jgi:hypothetical protein
MGTTRVGDATSELVPKGEHLCVLVFTFQPKEEPHRCLWPLNIFDIVKHLVGRPMRKVSSLNLVSITSITCGVGSTLRVCRMVLRELHKDTIPVSPQWSRSDLRLE